MLIMTFQIVSDSEMTQIVDMQHLCRCDTAFIQPLLRNKPNVINLITNKYLTFSARDDKVMIH